MADSNGIEVLLHFCEDQYNWCRHTENQRSTMTNLIIMITAALLALIGYLGFEISSLLISVFLIILGISGVIMTLKYHERFRLHLELAGQWANRIDELCPNAKLNLLAKQGFQKHEKSYAKLTNLQLHWFWVFIHILISLLGLASTVIIIYYVLI